jgi:hypothetical protein
MGLYCGALVVMDFISGFYLRYMGVALFLHRASPSVFYVLSVE